MSAASSFIDPVRDLPAAIALIDRLSVACHPYDGVLLKVVADTLRNGPASSNEYPGEDALVDKVAAALWAGRLGDRLTAIRAVRVVLDEQARLAGTSRAAAPASEAATEGVLDDEAELPDAVYRDAIVGRVARAVFAEHGIDHERLPPLIAFEVLARRLATTPREQGTAEAATSAVNHVEELLSRVTVSAAYEIGKFGITAEDGTDERAATERDLAELIVELIAATPRAEGEATAEPTSWATQIEHVRRELTDGTWTHRGVDGDLAAIAAGLRAHRCTPPATEVVSGRLACGCEHDASRHTCEQAAELNDEAAR